MNEYDAFISDLRVYKMLPAVLGREFYRTKKFPAPVKLHDLKKKELQEALNSAAQKSVFMMGNGPNYSVKVGNTSMEVKSVAENVMSSLSQAIGYVTVHDEDIKFSKLQQITLSIAGSPNLPVFSQFTQSEIDAYENHK